MASNKDSLFSAKSVQKNLHLKIINVPRLEHVLPWEMGTCFTSVPASKHL